MLLRRIANLNLVNSILRRTFSQDIAASWPPELRHTLRKLDIVQPTKIQEMTLPHLLNNKDLVGIARTGSGKTLAFLIPYFLRLLQERRESAGDWRPKTRCLILAPTRELADQTNSVIRQFRNLDIKSIALVGGSSRSKQVFELSDRTFDFFVATPGRLIDLCEDRAVDLSAIEYLVLDEADRMLDMGFEPQIRSILKRLPKTHQTVMWSATWPDEVQELAEDFMNDYEKIAIDSDKLKANPNINQIIQVCRPTEKFQLLLDALSNYQSEMDRPRVLIFVNTRAMADMLQMQLMRRRIKSESIHGNKSQSFRDRALKNFKQGYCDILIATSLVARGIDVSDISHVINYDLPADMEDYIHRIGRTARHERKGTALSFVTDNDGHNVKKLIKILQETNQPVPSELESMFISARSNSFTNRNNRSYGRSQGQYRRKVYVGQEYDRFDRYDKHDDQPPRRSRIEPEFLDEIFERTSNSNK